MFDDNDEEGVQSVWHVAAHIRRWGETVHHPIGDMADKDIVDLLEHLSDSGVVFGKMTEGRRISLSNQRFARVWRS